MSELLPVESKIKLNGFDASWDIDDSQVESLKREHKASIYMQHYAISVFLAGKYNQYETVEQASKYTIIFITLVFALFLFYDYINKKRIHPVQYLMAGAAGFIFYITLISFSEHMSFNLSYIITSAALIIMILMYMCGAVIKNMPVKHLFITDTLLTELQTYAYVMLQLPEIALIAGSLSLFIILAIIMYATRNINWYNDTVK